MTVVKSLSLHSIFIFFFFFCLFFAVLDPNPDSNQLQLNPKHTIKKYLSKRTYPKFRNWVNRDECSQRDTDRKQDEELSSPHGRSPSPPC
jgi:hypothetical protein